jgi:hypothetical protein
MIIRLVKIGAMIPRGKLIYCRGISKTFFCPMIFRLDGEMVWISFNQPRIIAVWTGRPGRLSRWRGTGAPPVFRWCAACALGGACREARRFHPFGKALSSAVLNALDEVRSRDRFGDRDQDHLAVVVGNDVGAGHWLGGIIAPFGEDIGPEAGEQFTGAPGAPYTSFPGPILEGARHGRRRAPGPPPRLPKPQPFGRYESR